MNLATCCVMDVRGNLVSSWHGSHSLYAELPRENPALERRKDWYGREQARPAPMGFKDDPTIRNLTRHRQHDQAASVQPLAAILNQTAQQRKMSNPMAPIVFRLRFVGNEAILVNEITLCLVLHALWLGSEMWVGLVPDRLGCAQISATLKEAIERFPRSKAAPSAALRLGFKHIQEA